MDIKEARKTVQTESDPKTAALLGISVSDLELAEEEELHKDKGASPDEWLSIPEHKQEP